jgi:signal transduction histidine kinase
MDEVEERASELESLRCERDRLVRSQQLRDETAALVVHDMKNPLSGVISNAEYLITTSGLDTDQSECARDILIAARRLHRLVMSLLDVNLREHGLLEPSITKLNLAELVAECVHDSAPTLQEKALRCALTGTESPIPLAADRDMLSRLVGNLIDNAARASPQGSAISVALSRRAQGVELRVTDSGPSLAPDYRAQLFDVTLPADEALRRARKGRGLGLTSCRAIAEAHGGRIGASDSEQGGSSIWVELPL